MAYRLNPYTNQRDFYEKLTAAAPPAFLYIGNIYLKSGNATYFEIAVTNDGVLTAAAGGSGFVPTYVLKSPGGLNYLLGIDDDGVPTTTSVGDYAVSAIILVSVGGVKYSMGVDDDGAITISNT